MDCVQLFLGFHEEVPGRLVSLACFSGSHLTWAVRFTVHGASVVEDRISSGARKHTFSRRHRDGG